MLKTKTKPKLDLKILNPDVIIQKQYAVQMNNRFKQLSSDENTAEEEWKQREEVL